MSKKIVGIIISILTIIILIGGTIYLIELNKNPQTPVEPNEEEKSNTNAAINNGTNNDINIVLSLEDKITENTAWCGTFNLIWNDLKNNLAKQDIEFTPQLETVKNLNKGTFNTSHLSKDSYYKTYGVPSLALKQEIEKAIKEKFDETSDILDSFDWENHGPEDYFLYAMLKKQFEFPNVFTELEDGKFGNYENVKYFGIDASTEEAVRNQVEVLYYNSKNDFAVKLLTKQNDEVIITRGSQKETFKEIYEEVEQKDEKYEGNHNFEKIDTLKVPNIKFDLKKEIEELENKQFEFANKEVYHIGKALQTIQFELDKKGGKIKSEAGMMVDKAAIMLPEEPREFSIDDTFTMFLKEEGKDLPYFATKIANITKVQK